MSDDDLVKRLRNTTIAIQTIFPTLRHEAADAIERLTADNAILSKWHIDAEARAEAAERKVEKLRGLLVEAYEMTSLANEYSPMGRLAIRIHAALAETENGDE